MASAEPFRVIIAGGGIAGLALANMLEKFDLDYLILEGHSSIAPAVGASIGMFPNGLRILDQLGCYEDIQDVFGGDVPYSRSHTRDENGHILTTMEDMSGSLEKRHGYGLMFFDRQKLLEILHDNIRQKEKVLCNKRVTGVDLVDGGVRVTCADGSVFPGSIVVGADGIHSAVRDAMTALGNKLQPGYFDPQERVPCYYKCSFGIAQHVPGWVAGEQHLVTGRGRSQLVASGPDDKVYWFMFEKLPETKYDKDIPKFTKEDEAEFVRRNKDVPITESVTFGDVYGRRISSTLTPLHEVVYKKWFFRRIITLGDSAHKPNPLGGQGANGALESCAVLVNTILRTRERRGGALTGLTDEEVETIFTETQSTRHERAELILKRAHDQQTLFAYESPWFSTLIFKIVQPLAGESHLLSSLAALFAGAAKLDGLPVPPRPREIPFDDEVPEKTFNEKTRGLVGKAFVGGVVGGILWIIAAKAFDLPTVGR
ncbi:related to hydroxylase [Cephalotrichum gorgonifer]|uniref:Related to hydroxylase n=1 Tax=Cephalotrichum gorgonifer TaxID=2041049 RepID=A0AAE8T0D1_9PEZI|nr:related to hydroxylase [Cephalotrichum gorgonifer]